MWSGGGVEGRIESPTPRPAPLRPDETDLWQQEREEYNALLALDLAELRFESCLTVLDLGPIFLPAAHLRWFAPALARHAVRIVTECSEYEVEQLVACIVQSLPLQLPPETPAQLRDAARAWRLVACDCHAWGRRFFPPEAPGEWRTPTGAGPGVPKLLALLAELEGASPANRDLFGTTDRDLAFAISEHDWCVVNRDWRPTNPAALELYTLDAVIERQERLAASEEPAIAANARLVLGS
jgi:hypothetical protein